MSPEDIQAIQTAVVKGLEPRFDAMDGRLDAMDGRLDAMDGRLDAMDGRLDAMDGRLDAMDGRLDAMDGRLEVIDRRFEVIDRRFDVMYQELLAIHGVLDEHAQLLGGIDRRMTNVEGILDGVEILVRKHTG